MYISHNEYNKMYFKITSTHCSPVIIVVLFSNYDRNYKDNYTLHNSPNNWMYSKVNLYLQYGEQWSATIIFGDTVSL